LIHFYKRILPGLKEPQDIPSECFRKIGNYIHLRNWTRRLPRITMETGGRCRQLSITEEFGRLDVVLDRSWEVQPVTWGALTWWDPLPCGKELIASLGNTEPLPFPSPALSVVGHPPTPGRKLPPQALNFRSSSASPSPIPLARGHANRQYTFRGRSGSSPLAFPLPPSPDSQSFNSVFLHSESDPSPSYQQQQPGVKTPSPHYMCSSPVPLMTRKESLNKGPYPTPPDSVFHHNRQTREQFNTRSGNMFSFSKVPFPSQFPNQTSGPVKMKSFSQSAVSTMSTPPSVANERALRPTTMDLAPTDSGSGSNCSYY